MFERFTDQARRVVVLAQDEARMLGHNYIGTEHILLGLVREGDGVGAQVLVRLGADLPDVRARVLETVKTAPAEGARRVPATAQMMGSRIQLEQMTGRMGEVLSRLGEISGRLAAIESLLAEMRGQRPRRSRKPPAGGEAGSTGQAGPTAEPGQPEPPAAQA